MALRYYCILNVNGRTFTISKTQRHTSQHFTNKFRFCLATMFAFQLDQKN